VEVFVERDVPLQFVLLRKFCEAQLFQFVELRPRFHFIDHFVDVNKMVDLRVASEIVKKGG
jgi:hypothetical protein